MLGSSNGVNGFYILNNKNCIAFRFDLTIEMLTSKVHRVAILAVIVISVVSVSARSTGGDDNSSGTAIGCEIPFSSKVHIGYQWPLIFRTNGSLYDTVHVDGGDSVVVGSGEEVIVSCGPNYIKSRGKSEQTHAKCGPEGQFQLDAQWEGVNLKDLTCDMRVIEETLQPVYGCPINLTSTNFGYVHPLQKHTYIIGESCYDITAGKTHFAHIKLGGPSEYMQKADNTFLLHNRPNSKYKIEFFKALRFDELYERVRSILGINEAPGFRLSNFVDESLLMHNQLNAVKKLSWNYFLMRDNLFTLNLLKEDIKELSYSMELDIYIGSHGVNVLQNSNGAQMEFYAAVGDGQIRFPMPELIWILVKNADKAVTFGVFNDPDLQSEDVSRKSSCKSECEKITWLTRVASSKYRGPLICCRYDDFIRVVKEVPLWSGINDLFT